MLVLARFNTFHPIPHSSFTSPSPSSRLGLHETPVGSTFLICITTSLPLSLTTVLELMKELIPEL